MQLLIQSLYELKKKSPEAYHQACEEILQLTTPIQSCYNNYQKWCSDHMGKVGTKGRETFYVTDELSRIIAISSVKNYYNLKRICAFYVQPEYRRHGFGSSLMEFTMNYLQTTTPIISMPDYHYPEFKSMIERYNWQLDQIEARKDGNKGLVFYRYNFSKQMKCLE